MPNVSLHGFGNLVQEDGITPNERFIELAGSIESAAGNLKCVDGMVISSGSPLVWRLETRQNEPCIRIDSSNPYDLLPLVWSFRDLGFDIETFHDKMRFYEAGFTAVLQIRKIGGPVVHQFVVEKDMGSEVTIGSGVDCVFQTRPDFIAGGDNFITVSLGYMERTGDERTVFNHASVTSASGSLGFDIDGDNKAHQIRGDLEIVLNPVV